MDENNYSVVYRCPSCFMTWNEFINIDKPGMDRLCDFCEKDPNTAELTYRMMDVLSGSKVSDFPDVVRQIVKYIDFRMKGKD